MKYRRISAYEFAELSDTAKGNAADFINEGAYQWEYEHLKEEADMLGFTLTAIDTNPISGSGEFFTGPKYTAEKILQEHGKTCETYILAEKFLQEFASIEKDIETSDSDCCQWEDKYNAAEYGSIEEARAWAILEPKQENFQRLEDDLKELEKEFASDLAHEYACIYSRQMEYIYSEEYLQETCEANEYLFNEHGRII